MFRNELTACLTLVAPVGMDEESRRDWLAVAWDTLKHLPPHILASGARHARQVCDHPSKIVPAIIASTADWMAFREPSQECSEPPLQIGVEYITPSDAASILEEYGLKPSTAAGMAR